MSLQRERESGSWRERETETERQREKRKLLSLGCLSPVCFLPTSYLFTPQQRSEASTWLIQAQQDKTKTDLQITKISSHWVGIPEPSLQLRRPVHGPDHIISLLPFFVDYGCRQHLRSGCLRRGPGPGEAPGRGGQSRPHMLSAPRASLGRGCRGSPDWAPVLNPGARLCGGGGVGAGRRHVLAAAATAEEDSISSAASSRAHRGPLPRPAPACPARGSPPGRAAGRLRGRPRPSGWRTRRVLRQRGRTPVRRPRHPVGAVHGEHIMAIEGKWRPAAVWEEGERPGSRAPRRPGGRGAGGALACGRGAGRRSIGVPTASQETGGRSGAAGPPARSLRPWRSCRP